MTVVKIPAAKNTDLLQMAVPSSNSGPNEKPRVPTSTRPLGPFSVSPIGLGATRLAGPNTFGPPTDRDEVLAVLREAVVNGVDHIDTAQFIGPGAANDLIREALHPYPEGLILVTKVGVRRDRHGGVLIDDHPARLRGAVEENLRTLGLEAIPVALLHLTQSTRSPAFFDDQLDVMAKAKADGLIQSLGLSNVTHAQLLHALSFSEVACVQNRFHVKHRESESVLRECNRQKIAFVASAALGTGGSGPTSVLGAAEVIRESTRLGITPAQVALAWTLNFSPNVLIVPGTSSVHHLRENLAVSSIHIDFESVRRLTSM